MPCPHLVSFENELRERGLRELRRGVPFCGWGEWVFFDCRFDLQKISQRHRFSPCVEAVEKVLACWPVQAFECSVCGAAVASFFSDETEQIVVK